MINALNVNNKHNQPGSTGQDPEMQNPFMFNQGKEMTLETKQPQYNPTATVRHQQAIKHSTCLFTPNTPACCSHPRGKGCITLLLNAIPQSEGSEGGL